jgi:hypothetical protein
MSERYGSFYPEDAVIGGFLDGREGEIRKASFVTFDYNGTVDPPAHQLLLDIVRDDGEDREERYGIGGCRISEDGNFFTGSLRKSARLFTFLTHLKKSGFPMKRLNEEGAAALDGARFNWMHLPVKNSDNTFAVPVKYLGAEEEKANEETEELRQVLSILVAKAVTDAGGTLKKTKVNAAIKDEIADAPYAGKVTALLLNDEFLASLDGVNYADGVLSV